MHSSTDEFATRLQRFEPNMRHAPSGSPSVAMPLNDFFAWHLPVRFCYTFDICVFLLQEARATGDITRLTKHPFGLDDTVTSW